MEENQIQELNEKDNLEKNRRIFNKYLAFFAVIFLLAGSFYFGYRQGENKAGKNNTPAISINRAQIENRLPGSDEKIDFSLFWKVWDLLKEKHIDKEKISAQNLVYGAINGMLKATGDPYSNFFSPEESKAFSEDLGGSFDGIGAELGIKDNILTVIAPLDSSPAQKSGLRAGDKILKIGDKVSTDLTIDEAVGLIRGKKGTEVTLTVLHVGDQATLDVKITRDTIEIKSVKTEFRDDGIAHVKITKFGENTSREFNETVSQIISRGSKGIILDLRNDPGGLLDKAVEIASKMIPSGKVVVMEEDSAGKKESLSTQGGDKLSSIPTVVLINEGSASASEILAGALRDDQNITLVGMKSFGKGSVQELMSLPGGSSVKITIAKWLTPNGDYIMEKGINPDVEVPMTADDFNNNRDPQLDKAVEVLKGKM
jgi:carboxyl-terminal processing protease